MTPVVDAIRASVRLPAPWPTAVRSRIAQPRRSAPLRTIA